MDTKSTTVLWLPEQSPPLITPSSKQVLLQLYGYHKHFQSKTTLQSFAMEFLKLVVKDIKNWWVKIRIPTKTNQAIEKMILHDVDEYKLRKKNRNRKTKLEETKREQFFS